MDSTLKGVVAVANQPEPSSLMDIVRDGAKHFLDHPDGNNTALKKRLNDQPRVDATQPWGKVYNVAHATTLSSAPSTTQPQQQPLPHKSQQLINMVEALHSLVSDTARGNLDPHQLSVVAKLLGVLPIMLERTKNSRTFNDVRGRVSSFLSSVQAKPSSSSASPIHAPPTPRLPQTQPPMQLKEQQHVTQPASSTGKKSPQPQVLSSSLISSSSLPPQGARLDQHLEPGGGGRGINQPTVGRDKGTLVPLPPPPIPQPIAKQQQKEPGRPKEAAQPPNPSPPTLESLSESAPVPSASPTAQPSIAVDPSVKPKQRGHRGRPFSLALESAFIRKCFRLRVPVSHPLARIREVAALHDGVCFVMQQLQLPTMMVSDVFRQGPDIIFSVHCHSYADAVVRNRCKLKGSGLIIFDVLSATEGKHHSDLVPRFQEAKAAGQRAQFVRGRLKVDGKWV